MGLHRVTHAVVEVPCRLYEGKCQDNKTNGNDNQPKTLPMTLRKGEKKNGRRGLGESEGGRKGVGPW